MDRGQRLCPVCWEAEQIEAGESVWPGKWVCGACGSAVPVVGGIPYFAESLADTEQGFDIDAFEFLSRFEAGHYWFEPRNRLLTGLAQKYFPHAHTYLEVGCGTGFVLNAFSSMKTWSSIVGSELHPSGLIHARQRVGNRATFVQMDARHVPARSAFDLVGAYDVLEHIVEDEAVLRGIHACLVQAGGIIVAVPQHPSLWSAADDYGHHVRRYRRGELERKLTAAGFEILFSTSYTAMLLPLMAASRLRRRAPANVEWIKAEFDINPLVNRALRTCLELEVSGTLGGMRWPAGGSRIVVAQKASD